MEKLRPGDRVQYIGPPGVYSASGHWITGTVERLIPGYKGDLIDGGEGRLDNPLPYPENWSAVVKVDEQPKGWPYPHTSRFYPSISDLELVQGIDVHLESKALRRLRRSLRK